MFVLQRKFGASKVDGTSELCSIFTNDGSVYTIRACVFSEILQLNPRLETEPSLLSNPCNEGFIAIVRPF